MQVDEKTKVALRKTLEGMTNKELVMLLLADDPQRYPSDEWFRELIADVLKTRKVDEP